MMHDFRYNCWKPIFATGIFLMFCGYALQIGHVIADDDCYDGSSTFSLYLMLRFNPHPLLAFSIIFIQYPSAQIYFKGGDFL